MEDERETARSSEMVAVILKEYADKNDEIVSHVKRGTSSWKSVIIGIASSFVFGLLLTAAQVVQQ